LQTVSTAILFGILASTAIMPTLRLPGRQFAIVGLLASLILVGQFFQVYRAGHFLYGAVNAANHQRWEACANDFKFALNALPNDSLINYEMGRILFIQGNYKEAFWTLQRAQNGQQTPALYRMLAFSSQSTFWLNQGQFYYPGV